MANRAFEIALGLFLFVNIISFLTTVMPVDETVTTGRWKDGNIQSINETATELGECEFRLINILNWGFKIIELAARSILLILLFVIYSTVLVPFLLNDFGVPMEFSIIISSVIWIIYAVGLYNMFNAKQGI